jgi:hypothetical protein
MNHHISAALAHQRIADARREADGRRLRRPEPRSATDRRGR